ncbi:hypothetical protein SDC9_86250 [bioreactor metagenome]|uniref:Uncharacterized protein n=1 Tax=bioreactor metagenome TaxID=1076179 RepID=A0A644ZFK1_9ZZZZ
MVIGINSLKITVVGKGVGVNGNKQVGFYRVGDVRALVKPHVHIPGAGHNHVITAALQNALHLQGHRKVYVLLRDSLIERSRAVPAVARVQHHGLLLGINRNRRSIIQLFPVGEIGRDQDTAVGALHLHVILICNPIPQVQHHAHRAAPVFIEVVPVLGKADGRNQFVVHLNLPRKAGDQHRAQHVHHHPVPEILDVIGSLIIGGNQHGLGIGIHVDVQHLPGDCVPGCGDCRRISTLIPAHLPSQLFSHKAQGDHRPFDAAAAHRRGWNAVGQGSCFSVHGGLCRSEGEHDGVISPEQNHLGDLLHPEHLGSQSLAHLADGNHGASAPDQSRHVLIGKLRTVQGEVHHREE